MSTATGIVGGALTLATLQLVLSSQGATSAYGALATGPASWLEKIMDAGVNAIPDHTVNAPPGSAGSSPSSVAAAADIPAPSSLPPASQPTTLSV